MSFLPSSACLSRFDISERAADAANTSTTVMTAKATSLGRTSNFLLIDIASIGTGCSFPGNSLISIVYVRKRRTRLATSRTILVSWPAWLAHSHKTRRRVDGLHPRAVRRSVSSNPRGRSGYRGPQEDLHDSSRRFGGRRLHRRQS